MVGRVYVVESTCATYNTLINLQKQMEFSLTSILAQNQQKIFGVPFLD
jgi:hypothetical protein